MSGTEKIKGCSEIKQYLLQQSAPVHEGRLLKFAYSSEGLPGSQELLFRYHFELYHSLYMIKDIAGQEGLYLHLDPMRIRLLPLSAGCSFYFDKEGAF